MSAAWTALGGTLERRAEGWCWRDGTPEPRARDMTLGDIAPNFRCTQRGGSTYVEVPHDWVSDRHWPGGRVDPDALRGVRELIESRGTRAGAIYAEGLAEALDDHRLSKRGWLVPIEAWDAVLRGEPCGCWWDQREQESILARARSLGWEG